MEVYPRGSGIRLMEVRGVRGEELDTYLRLMAQAAAFFQSDASADREVKSCLSNVDRLTELMAQNRLVNRERLKLAQKAAGSVSPRYRTCRTICGAQPAGSMPFAKMTRVDRNQARKAAALLKGKAAASSFIAILAEISQKRLAKPGRSSVYWWQNY